MPTVEAKAKRQKDKQANGKKFAAVTYLRYLQTKGYFMAGLILNSVLERCRSKALGSLTNFFNLKPEGST
jgi:hypothetical protein